MTEEGRHILTDEQLEEISGGKTLSIEATPYVHAGCGGEIKIIEDYDDSFMGFLVEWSGGPARYSKFYRCTKCQQIFEEKSSEFVSVG